MWCAPRRSRSRCRPATCAAERDPRDRTRCGSSPRRRDDPTLEPDALRARLHRTLHCLAHRTTEGHPLRELLGDTLGDKLRVDLGVLHLEDVQLNLLAGQLLESPRIRSASATRRPITMPGRAVWMSTRTRSRGALDLHARDSGALHALRHQCGEWRRLLSRNPGTACRRTPALEFGGDAEPEPVRVDLLAH